MMKNSPTIPVHLLNLFETMDFLSSAKKNGKPCFNTRRYIDRDSYFGALFRWISGEKQSTHGNNIIRSCCEMASQALTSYYQTDYETILLDKIMGLRRGLLEICDTYSKDDTDIDTVNHIKNSVMILDLKIPYSVKVTHGLLAPTPKLISSVVCTRF